MKTSPRIHIEDRLEPARDIHLSKDQGHYLTGVLRLAPGDPLRAFNAVDGEWLAYLATVSKKLVTIRCERRVADAVATPDGRYITVPSHYTAANTISFYDAATLLARLDAGRDAADVAAVYEHRHPNVHDVYYQSIGVLPPAPGADRDTTTYRMMFSGSTTPAMPGFRIVDYVFKGTPGAAPRVTASEPMRLCPQISRDMATPFISKDGLEHGAFWAICALAAIMFIGVHVHIPETITGLIGAVLIAASLWSSIPDNRAALPHCAPPQDPHGARSGEVVEAYVYALAEGEAGDGGGAA